MESTASSVIGKLNRKKIIMINNDDLQHLSNHSPANMEPQKINYYKIKQIVKNAQSPRPEEEEEQKKPVVEKTTQCLTCNGMKDFITSLQREIQRLHGVTTDLTKQLITAGGEPDIPPHLMAPTLAKRGMGGKGFQNICPTCKRFQDV